MWSNRINLFSKAVCVLPLVIALSASAPAQGTAEVLWQAANAGNAIAFSPDGQTLLAGTTLWRVSDGTLIRTFRLPYQGSGVSSVAYSPNGQYAAIGIQSFNDNLDLFRVSDGALIAGRISAHSNGTTSVAFSPDGQMLASGGRDGTAKLWHLPDMTLIQTVNTGIGYRARVFAVSFSADGHLLAVGGQGGVLLFRVSDGSLVQSLSGASSTTSLAMSPDGQSVAAGSNATDQYGQCVDCSIKIWRISDGALLRTIDGNNNVILSTVFAPDQQSIAAGSADRVYNGVVRVWRISDGALIKTLTQDPNNPAPYVSSVAYAPDGSLLAFARQDRLLVVTRNNTAACTFSLSSTSQSFASSAGGNNVSVSTGAGCNWTAMSNAGWITITSPQGCIGNDGVSFLVKDNPTGSARMGTLTIAGQTFTVNQNGASSQSCSFSLSPASVFFSAGGGVGSAQVNATAGCFWRATTNKSWITIASSNSGVGNGTLTFSVAQNQTGITRKGTVMIADHVFVIKQQS